MKNSASRYTIRKQEKPHFSCIGRRQSPKHSSGPRGQSEVLLLEMSGATPMKEDRKEDRDLLMELRIKELELKHQQEMEHMRQTYERKLWRANARYIRAKADADKHRSLACQMKRLVREMKNTGRQIIQEIKQTKEPKRQARFPGRQRTACEHEISLQTELSEGLEEENLRTERLRMPLVGGVT